MLIKESEIPGSDDYEQDFFIGSFKSHAGCRTVLHCVGLSPALQTDALPSEPTREATFVTLPKIYEIPVVLFPQEHLVMIFHNLSVLIDMNW